jgi:hypothetical protein
MERRIMKKKSMIARKDPKETAFTRILLFVEVAETARASVVNLDLEDDARLGDGVSGGGMCQNG